MPCGNQLISSKTLAGDYARELDEVYKNLIAHTTNGAYPDHRTIWNLLSKAYPRRKDISACDIFNTCVRAKAYLLKAIKEGKPLADFSLSPQQRANLTSSLDNNTSDIMDEALQSIKEIFVENLANDTCNMRLFAMLETLGSKDSGFTYALCHDSDGTLSGFVWMTAVMR